MGKSIEVGTYVATFAPKYRHMMMGRVINLTAKLVVVKYFNSWNFGPGRGVWCEHKYSPTELIVLTDEYALQKILNNPILLD